MDDLISRQDAIDALNEQIEQCNKALSSFDISMKDEYAVRVERASLVAFRETLEYVSSAQPDVPDINVGNCPYCHEDSDGFVFPIEKNGHAYVWHDVDGWVISLKAKGWRGSCRIKFCPMCGRELKHG